MNAEIHQYLFARTVSALKRYTKFLRYFHPLPMAWFPKPRQSIIEPAYRYALRFFRLSHQSPPSIQLDVSEVRFCQLGVQFYCFETTLPFCHVFLFSSLQLVLPSFSLNWATYVAQAFLSPSVAWARSLIIILLIAAMEPQSAPQVSSQQRPLRIRRPISFRCPSIPDGILH